MNAESNYTADGFRAHSERPRHDAAASSAERISAAFRNAHVRRDVKTLARFIVTYCDGLHGQAIRQPVLLRSVDVKSITGRPVVLCTECRRLLTHAMMKRAMCPLDPKPACKHCANHCYAPHYRDQIRQVMRYAGNATLAATAVFCNGVIRSIV